MSNRHINSEESMLLEFSWLIDRSSLKWDIYHEFAVNDLDKSGTTEWSGVLQSKTCMDYDLYTLWAVTGEVFGIIYIFFILLDS